MSNPPPPADEPVPDGWSDLTEDERAELRADFAEARAEIERGECIPVDEVLPRRLRRAG